ncbi:MAG: translation initiation factor IF-2 [Chitinophagales bacterium]|nr:translation initiation factor IF-2 [Chitinophagales bacterium]
MSDYKPIRLVAAAKKFNVGTGTIVETLDKKGLEIDNKPTSKLTEEMYNVLLKEFRSEMNIKEEAEQITLGLKKRENVELEKEATVKVKKEEPKEVVIQVNSGDTDTKVEKVVETREAEKLEGPKIVGKIEIKEKKKAEPKVEEKKEEKKVAKKETKKKEEAKKDEKKKKEEVEKVEEKKKETKKKEDKKEVKEEKKKKEEEKKEPEIIKAKFEKLQGPKILGKIELKEPKPKKKDKPESKDDDPNKKRRRKRIIKTKKINPGESRRGDDRRGKRGKRPDTKDTPQVSEKEIEEKIKATMAKLSVGSGKSSRAKLRKAKRTEHAEAQREQDEQRQDNLLEVTEFISVSELANMMGVPPIDVIKTCMNLGVIVSINQRLDAEIIELVADEFNFEVEFISLKEQDAFIDEFEIDPEDMDDRAPIVTIMGHVDHGKTTLLDYIRESKVASGEAGGITQHIGAYEVKTENGKKITFLDTPGHEAFTAMRARGAKITDIAVIVIAADDQIMPQTKEAISHAQSAGVPMIFAINKIDKDGANPEKIKEQLSEMNLLVEDWGGKFQSQDLSAKSGENVDTLLDKILLEAELLELKSNPEKNAIGSTIEASLDKGRGYVATLLVQNGSMRVGDIVVAGSYSGKVKAMFDHTGNKVKVAGPSTPVQVLGISGAPQAGEKFKIFDNEQEAKQIASKRGQIEREQGIRATKHITLDEIGRRLALGNFKELNIIIKGDVDGSVEATSDALLKLSTEEIQVKILHSGVGQITESDVLLASASDAIIIGFQVRPSLNARKLAEAENIEIRLYSVIYHAIEEIKSAMEGMLEPKIEEKITANIEIKEIFKITKVGTIAGCQVLDGKIKRNSKVRVVRDGIVVYTGELESLKRFKDDVKEVTAGQDCGLNVKDFNDVKVGDIVEAYEEIEVQRTL